MENVCKFIRYLFILILVLIRKLDKRLEEGDCLSNDVRVFFRED